MGLPSSCRRCSSTSLVCMLLAMSCMHCSPTQARDLPSMPCAQRTVSLSALTRAVPGSERERFLRV
eukprot:2247546-Pyramimonas_sp.AAC.1